MISFRNVNINDLVLCFDWANDTLVREQSFNSKKIDFENHKKWFESKLKDKFCIMFIFQNEENLNIGQIRIQMGVRNEAIIGISVASGHRGKGYAIEMLKLASDYFLIKHKNYTINAYIKEQNKSSKYAFEKAGFKFNNMLKYEKFLSFHYIKKGII